MVTGGVSVSEAVLKERYDYIFYTGNSQVSSWAATEREREREKEVKRRGRGRGRGKEREGGGEGDGIQSVCLVVTGG